MLRMLSWTTTDLGSSVLVPLQKCTPSTRLLLSCGAGNERPMVAAGIAKAANSWKKKGMLHFSFFSLRLYKAIQLRCENRACNLMKAIELHYWQSSLAEFRGINMNNGCVFKMPSSLYLPWKVAVSLYLSIYIYIYIHTYIQVYINIYIHVCMYIYIYIYLYMYVYICLYVYVFTYTKEKHLFLLVFHLQLPRLGCFAVKAWKPRGSKNAGGVGLTTTKPDVVLFFSPFYLNRSKA